MLQKYSQLQNCEPLALGRVCKKVQNVLNAGDRQPTLEKEMVVWYWITEYNFCYFIQANILSFSFMPAM